MKRKLLVIVDVINGFINDGPMSDPSINSIIPSIVNSIKDSIDNNQDIVAFLDTHEEDSLEFSAYPVHCLRNTSEAELVPELLPFKNKMICIEKNSTNGFHQPQFKELLNNKYDEIEVVGCCTDICVLQFTLSLKTYFNETNNDTLIYINEPSVATYDSPKHNKEEYHKMALNLMEQAAVKIYRRSNDK